MENLSLLGTILSKEQQKVLLGGIELGGGTGWDEDLENCGGNLCRTNAHCIPRNRGAKCKCDTAPVMDTDRFCKSV